MTYPPPPPACGPIEPVRSGVSDNTMIRLTGYTDGGPVLVRAVSIVAVSTWGGADPHTVVTLHGAHSGAVAVRETPTEVNNLLAHAGVRIIGADTDNRGVGHGALIVEDRDSEGTLWPDRYRPRVPRSVPPDNSDDWYPEGRYDEPYTGAMDEDQG